MQKKQVESGGELVFVVETCQNCKEHHWNTRHDETKYDNFFNKTANTITSRIPNATVLRNQIPKSYLNYDLYCNLVPNEDDNRVVFDQVPRTGSFEVSYKGMLIFSKLQSSYWPNTQLVADKCFNLLSDEKQSKDLTKYFAGNSPTKSGEVKKTVAVRTGKSPNKKFDDSQQQQAFFPNAQAKLQKSPSKQQDIANPGSIMQQHTQQQKESSQKQLAPSLNQNQKQASQLSQGNPKFLDESQASQKVIPQTVSSTKSQKSVSQLQEAKQEVKTVPQAKQEEAKKEPTQQPQKQEQHQSQQQQVHQEKPQEKEPEEYDNDFAQEEPDEPEETPEEDVPVGQHLKSSDEITGYPIFPQGTKSLLSKKLSREVWDELKNKVDKEGFSFKSAIFSGCKNTDSGIGVYAGSHDSYDTFADLFDQIIEEYHGHKNTSKHPSNMNYKLLNAPEITGEDAKLIKSTRIRVGRNLANYPLGPGISNKQRKEIEEIVVKAVNSFTGELKGKYYALSSLSEQERKQLIEDHFLFKEGDRFLEACGLNRDWPNGRGIFHNDAKTFLVWVNEEDQLRIISMQNGADLGQVFQRLSQACVEIEKVAQFAHDNHLGYITSCPTNLGTALRASVHIYLPNLGKNTQEFQAIADKYHVQIRGAHGEHTETDDHIYDISNKRRLGLGEVELVQDMYNGVLAMIKRENELAPPKVVQDIQAGSQLKKPEDITGFPIFPKGTKSLLSKYLSREIWEKLKDQKDKYGFTFKQAIISGTQNVDSGIGVYAGSHDSYYAFAEFFDKIIEDYHGHKTTDKHVSDMDYTKLNAPPFNKKQSELIKSTRIRVGRNLADYPLGPGLTKEQRKQIESTVSKALTSFEGELQGKYYALTSLTEQERKQLVEDHFLFKEGDRFLEAVGLNREWPDGRGIFHNAAKTFLVWVNEEDQLRIISMQQGADLLDVFTRLSKACTHIEKVAKFSHDEHLGYITSCPTNLGTALRASVHIYLPNLSKNKEEFQAIADKYHVQIRGAHGEHTETDDHIFDISNKRRLGRSEVDLVQDMYNGVKVMISRELELTPVVEQKDIQAGSNLKSVDDLKGFPVFPLGTKSLLSKYLTKDIWNKYQDQQDAHGFSFKSAILSGCQNIDSGIGVYAGSHDSYKTFAEFFDKIIEDYHGHKTTDKHVSNMDYKKLDAPPLPEEDAKMIKSTRIRVGRNLADYPLGPGLTQQQRQEIEQKVTQALKSFEGELAGKYYALTSLKEEERKQLIEDHFLFKEGDRFLESCGLNRNWPEARGIFHNDQKSFLVWVNEEDQLRIISMQNGADIGAVFARLSKACDHIETVAKFAHDDHLGYITSCPTNLGTALRASVHIHLPNLAKHKDDFQAIADQYHVQIRGAHGEHTETDDFIFDISNKRRLGRSEVDLVQDMYNGVKAMIAKEKEFTPKVEEVKDVQCGPNLKLSDQLTGFPVFPAGTKSLLSKYLTKEIWLKLKDVQDKTGFSFKQAIFSGCQNVDSGIGVYAGSQDSYYAFQDLFEPIIDEYHGYKKIDKHQSEMNPDVLNAPKLDSQDSKFIISTRIRVGRNLADFPLGPGLSNEQRKQIEERVSHSLQKLTGELAGKYHSLTSLTEKERKQLIDDHFLFKEGDRFLEACGLNRDWPNGRGIYHNDAKTFLVWINEEDQLRIISMQNDSDISAVFHRLAEACKQIEKDSKFAHDEHLGYITSCPTNLGTALRASVHIKLPQLGQNKVEFQKIADQFHVQIRGAHGEHTETDDHVYDISNKRRLGRGEVSLVQDMYNGVKAMIQKEKDLMKEHGISIEVHEESKVEQLPKATATQETKTQEQPKAVVAEESKTKEQPKADVHEETKVQEQPKAAVHVETKVQELPKAAVHEETKVQELPKATIIEETKVKEKPKADEKAKGQLVGSNLKHPEELVEFPHFPEGTHSLLSKYLTEDVWNKLKDSKDKHGFTFKQAIFSGCQNTDSGIGIYAGSHDSYLAFNDLLSKVVEDYHGHKHDDKHQSDMDATKLNCPAFSEEDSKRIVSTRIRVGRNLAAYPLGPQLTKDQRKEVEGKVVEALHSFEGDLKGKYYSLSSLSEEERKQLIEDHFLFKEGDRFLEACGLNRDWPANRGIFHNDTKTFLVWVNEEDQLRIISMQPGANIGEVFTRLSKACAHIEKVASFSHDEHLGYITSCPTNLGTALRASVHIKLPKLGENMKEFKAIADKYHVQIRGIHGEHSETADHTYDISNIRRLGLSEVKLVQDMYDGVKAMIEKEKAMP